MTLILGWVKHYTHILIASFLKYFISQNCVQFISAHFRVFVRDMKTIYLGKDICHHRDSVAPDKAYVVGIGLRGIFNQ